MAKFNIAIKKARGGGFRVCLTSADNGKLVLQGEIINKLWDATTEANNLRDAWNAKGNTITIKPLDLLPVNHRFSKNAGPVKKKKKP